MRDTAMKPRNLKRALLLQVIFVAVAFAAMVLLGNWFASGIVRENLMDNANGMLDVAQVRLSTHRHAFDATLTNFSEMMRMMALRGNHYDVLKAYIDGMSDPSRLENNELPTILGFFGYFEALPDGPALINGEGVVFPDTNALKAEWYQKAVATGGSIVETVPYLDAAGKRLLFFSRCLTDSSGSRLGVVGMQVCLDEIGDEIVSTALEQGGYGMLLNQDFIVLFHPNQAFVGGSMDNPELPVHIFAEELRAGNEVKEQPLVSYKGEDAVVFFNSLANGWHLGMVVPEAQFYNSIDTMALVLSLLGIALAFILIAFLIRLDMAREKSDDENKKKSMFLANMSHEIRTPINAIVGMTAIGRAASSSSRKDYCLAKIGDASRHLLSVVNDILDMSKIEANQIELSPAEFSFERMLQQAVNVVSVRADEKQQKLTVQIDPEIPPLLFADDQRLAQVITNLLSNAIKFTPDEGTIRLNTSLLNEADGVCTLKVEVCDTGIGIRQEQQAKLFRSFQQAESSTTRSYGGTGLGLAISKTIVEMMGGEIRVDSDLGKGTVMTFTVKAERVAASPDHDKRGTSWNNLRILVVDDDSEMLEYLNGVISGFGADCTLAQGAEEALRLVEERGGYDIYFIDLRMPGQNGISLTWDIRAREEKPESSVVIMISASDLAAVEQEAQKAGVDKFLLKPLFPSSIADIISECVVIADSYRDEAPQSIDGIFAGRHLLLAEDVEINREIVLALLEPTLLSIDCAENGAEAVRMFEAEPEKYDMIFMDIQMPKMDGYEAARRIRALDFARARTVPIFAMTANVFKEDIDKSLESGMNGHLGKPLDIDEVIATLIRQL